MQVLLAFSMGFILKAVGPGLVVPAMFRLQKTGLGKDQGIPSSIVIAASFDDIGEQSEVPRAVLRSSTATGGRRGSPWYGVAMKLCVCDLPNLLTWPDVLFISPAVAITGFSIFSTIAIDGGGSGAGWQIAKGPVQVRSTPLLPGDAAFTHACTVGHQIFIFSREPSFMVCCSQPFIGIVGGCIAGIILGFTRLFNSKVKRFFATYGSCELMVDGCLVATCPGPAFHVENLLSSSCFDPWVCSSCRPPDHVSAQPLGYAVRWRSRLSHCGLGGIQCLGAGLPPIRLPRQQL